MSGFAPVAGSGVDINAALKALSGGGGSLTDGVLQNILSQVEAAAAAAGTAVDGSSADAGEAAGPATVEATAAEGAGTAEASRRKLAQVRMGQMAAAGWSWGTDSGRHIFFFFRNAAALGQFGSTL